MRLLVSVPLVLARRFRDRRFGVACACGDTSARGAPRSADTVREYRGSYATGFEVSWFRPCEAERGDDTWWVTLTERRAAPARQPGEKVTGRPRAVFVRWRGTDQPEDAGGRGPHGARLALHARHRDAADEARRMKRGARRRRPRAVGAARRARCYHAHAPGPLLRQHRRAMPRPADRSEAISHRSSRCTSRIEPRGGAGSRRIMRRRPGIWLVFDRKSSRPDRLAYVDAVEEALCYGWIDSTVRSLDDTRYVQLMTPRKPKSTWARTNKAARRAAHRAGVDGRGGTRLDRARQGERLVGEPGRGGVARRPRRSREGASRAAGRLEKLRRASHRRRGRATCTGSVGRCAPRRVRSGSPTWRSLPNRNRGPGTSRQSPRRRRSVARRARPRSAAATPAKVVSRAKTAKSAKSAKSAKTAKTAKAAKTCEGCEDREDCEATTRRPRRAAKRRAR